MKSRQLSVLILIFYQYSAFIHADELTDSIVIWKKEIIELKKQHPYKSDFDVKTTQYYLLVESGPQILKQLFHEYNKGNTLVGVLFSKLTKIDFICTLDKSLKAFRYQDYPEFVRYPPAFHPEKKNNSYDTIWLYWWDKGRKLTPEIFTRKYNDYQNTKSKNDKVLIQEKYKTLQNMGIIILPLLLEKIEAGNLDLIPMFVYLSDQKDLKSAGDCSKWWKANKGKYKDVLDY